MGENKEGIIIEMKELSQTLFGKCVWCNINEIGDNLITCNECGKLHSLEESKEKAIQELKKMSKEEKLEKHANKLLNDVGMDIEMIIKEILKWVSKNYGSTVCNNFSGFLDEKLNECKILKFKKVLSVDYEYYESLEPGITKKIKEHMEKMKN